MSLLLDTLARVRPVCFLITSFFLSLLAQRVDDLMKTRRTLDSVVFVTPLGNATPMAIFDKLKKMFPNLQASGVNVCIEVALPLSNEQQKFKQRPVGRAGTFKSEEPRS